MAIFNTLWLFSTLFGYFLKNYIWSLWYRLVNLVNYDGLFLMNAVFSFIAATFVLVLLPETKNKVPMWSKPSILKAWKYQKFKLTISIVWKIEKQWTLWKSKNKMCMPLMILKLKAPDFLLLTCTYVYYYIRVSLTFLNSCYIWVQILIWCKNSWKLCGLYCICCYMVHIQTYQNSLWRKFKIYSGPIFKSFKSLPAIMNMFLMIWRAMTN